MTELMKLSDDALVERAKSDGTVFSLLVDRYHSRLVSYVLARCFSYHSSEDVVQEVWIRFYNSIQLYKPQGNLFGYLAAIARRLTIDAFRRNHLDVLYEAVPVCPESRDSDRRQEHLARSREVDAAVACEEQITLEELQVVIEKIPTEQREALELCYFSGLEGSEIADRTHVSIPTVKSRVRLGLEKVRSLVATSSHSGVCHAGAF